MSLISIILFIACFSVVHIMLSDLYLPHHRHRSFYDFHLPGPHHSVRISERSDNRQSNIFYKDHLRNKENFNLCDKWVCTCTLYMYMYTSHCIDIAWALSTSVHFVCYRYDLRSACMCSDKTVSICIFCVVVHVKNCFFFILLWQLNVVAWYDKDWSAI